MDVETFRVGGNRGWVITGFIALPILFPTSIASLILHILNIGPQWMFLGIFYGCFLFFLLFLGMFLPNFIWELRRKEALSGIKRMATIVKVFRKAHMRGFGNDSYDYSGYDHFMIIEYKDEDMNTTRSKIIIDQGMFYQIKKPTQILVHVKGRFAYVIWEENPKLYNQYTTFKEY